MRFFKHEEINGHGRCPTYLHRWVLFQPRWPARLWRGFGIYLHKFVGDDWSYDLHDHPKRFISIGLRGRYYEWTTHKHGIGVRCYTAPWLRTFPAEHKHRLTGPTPTSPCWTLVIVLWTVREWGFWPGLTDGFGSTWMHWRDYMKNKGGHADRSRSCL